MTNPKLSVRMSPSSCRWQEILTRWPGNALRKSGNGFASTPASRILTMPAGPALLVLMTERSHTVGLSPGHHPRWKSGDPDHDDDEEREAAPIANSPYPPPLGRGRVFWRESCRLAEELGGDAGWRVGGAGAGGGIDGAACRLIGLPFERDGVGRAHHERDHGLDEGGVRRERAAIAAALFPGHQGAAPVRTAADEDPDVLIRADGAGEEIGVGAQHPHRGGRRGHADLEARRMDGRA